MTSIIPTKIEKCWSYEDNNVQGATVKACAINFANPRTGVEARGVIKSRFDDKTPSMFDNMPVKECNPVKDSKCTVNVDGMFYKECDPKSDKKCTVNLGNILFQNSTPPRTTRRF